MCSDQVEQAVNTVVLGCLPAFAFQALEATRCAPVCDCAAAARATRSTAAAHSFLDCTASRMSCEDGECRNQWENASKITAVAARCSNTKGGTAESHVAIYIENLMVVVWLCVCVCAYVGCILVGRSKCQTSIHKRRRCSSIHADASHVVAPAGNSQHPHTCTRMHHVLSACNFLQNCFVFLGKRLMTRPGNSPSSEGECGQYCARAHPTLCGPIM